jgi:hypothetical protein
MLHYGGFYGPVCRTMGCSSRWPIRDSRGGIHGACGPMKETPLHPAQRARRIDQWLAWQQITSNANGPGNGGVYVKAC